MRGRRWTRSGQYRLWRDGYPAVSHGTGLASCIPHVTPGQVIFMARIFLLLAFATLAAVVLADDSFREKYDSAAAIAGWQAQPDWIRDAPSPNPTVQVVDGVAKFAVDEPNRGMKWRRAVDIPDIDLTPWLVIRYKVENYFTGRDYLLWVGDSHAGGDGAKLLAGDRIRADGQWHTQVFNLPEAGVVAPISALALQCFATDAGKAALWIDTIAVTDAPPTGAEGYEKPTGPGRTASVDLADATTWTVEPSWLADYTRNNSCRKTDAGVAFTVADAGMGAKWSRMLPEAIAGMRWVSLKYRAANLQALNDYALYVAGEGGGKAQDEQYAVNLADLVADNAWHVAIAPIKVKSIKSIAAQVQALLPNASLEFGGITFTEGKPVVKLTDVFECRPGWAAATEGFRAVELPPGNTDGPQLSRRLGYEGWIPDGKLTASGIPFSVRPGSDAAIMTPLKEPGSIVLSLSGKAAEMYFILGAQLPSQEEPSFGGGPLQAIRQVERFVAHIEYADGSSEEQFPYLLSRGDHIISLGIGVYSLALDPAKALKQVTFRDGMARGAFGLVAATLSDKPGPASAATAPQAAIVPAALKPAESKPASITQDNGAIRVSADSVGMTLDCRNGLRVTSIENRSGAGAALRMKPGPLFRFSSGDLSLTSADFTVKQIASVFSAAGPLVRVDLGYEKATPPVTVSVWIDVAGGREIGLRARCDTGGRDPKITTLVFPEVSGLAFSDRAEDMWYWMPRRGSVISNVPNAVREPYSGQAPTQIIGVWGQAQGTGLYMMTQDLNAVPRYYNIRKAGNEALLSVEYDTLNPVLGARGAGVSPAMAGETPAPRDFLTPRTVIGCNRGDWHEQLDRYREWVATWYKPAAPRKAWFREVFSFRQQFMNFGVPESSAMFDPKTKQFHFDEAVKRDAEAFGGVDYLHLFDWGWEPVHGRCGDYAPWDYLGGADNFRKAVQGVRDTGVPVGLYIEGYLVDPESDLGKAHGKDWQLLGPDGKPYHYFDPSYNICPWVPEWQDYLAATYARAKRETGAVGFYIDEYGFSSPMHDCYNPNHHHPVPVTPVMGERQMLQKVRAALGPDAAIYTEESPTDVNSQYQDGSFTYSISSAPDAWTATHINLYRFAFPTFKTIEIITCDNPLGSNVEAVKRVLFNGEAIWLEGTADRWFAPETRAYIAKAHSVLRANKQCFTSDFPVPLVPTLVQGISANMFPERRDEQGKTCWTIYNTNYRTASGSLIRVRHLPGATYRDELTGQEVPAKITDGMATLSLEIGPRDVAVVSRTTQ